jgi:hypothetical protein
MSPDRIWTHRPGSLAEDPMFRRKCDPPVGRSHLITRPPIRPLPTLAPRRGHGTERTLVVAVVRAALDVSIAAVAPPAKPARRRPRLTVGLREPVANRARRRGSVHADRPDTEAVQLRENATTGPRWRFAATTVSDRTRGRRGTSALRAEPVPLRSRDALSWSSSPRIRSGNRFVHVTSSTQCTTGDRDAGQVARMAGTCADQHGPMSSPAAKRSMAPLIASSLGPRPGRSVAAEGFLDSAVRRKSHHPLEVGVQPRPV